VICGGGINQYTTSVGKNCHAIIKDEQKTELIGTLISQNLRYKPSGSRGNRSGINRWT